METWKTKLGFVIFLVSILIWTGAFAQQANVVVLQSDELPAEKLEMLKNVFIKLGYNPEIFENDGIITTDYKIVSEGSAQLELRFKARVTLDKILLQGFYMDPLWNKEILISRTNKETDGPLHQSWRELIKLSLLISLADEETN